MANCGGSQVTGSTEGFFGGPIELRHNVLLQANRSIKLGRLGGGSGSSSFLP